MNAATITILATASLARATEFLNSNELKDAVSEWISNYVDAEVKYGPIVDWDVSAITDMSYLFYYSRKNFNADIRHRGTVCTPYMGLTAAVFSKFTQITQAV